MYSLMSEYPILKYDFYFNDSGKIAKELLGKILVRKFGDKILTGKIVETEAYYGRNDPASRAYRGVNKISKLMFGKPGKLLVYMVHANYLVNIIAHPLNSVGAVLIRALEPIHGIEIMKINRRLDNDMQLCSGPGKLTKALGIEKVHHGLDVTDENSEITIININKKNNFEIIKSFRIGVQEDLPKKLRFCIKDNKYVSRNIKEKL